MRLGVMRIGIGCFIGLLLLAVTGCSGTMGQRVLEQPLDEISYDPPTPVEWKLDNGLTVLFLQDKELPLVYGELLMPGGSFWEPEDMPGIVNLMGSQMREGGAGRLSADALDQRLEELSAGIGSSFGEEYGSVSFSSLSSDLNEVFALFADVVRHPRFEESRLRLAQGQILESIRRRTDDPNTIASLAFRELVFGDGTYGKILSSADVQKMKRIELLRMHRSFVRPSGSYLVVSGDVEQDEVERLAQKYFAKWEPRKEPLPEPPALQFTPTPAIYFLEFPFQQATVLMGHQGPTRLTEDHIAINAFNEVFGTSGFASKLMQVVREDKGLAYGVGGYIAPGLVTGTNSIYLQTKSETADQAMVAAIEVLKDLQERELSEAELVEAKEIIQSARVFKFVSPYQVVEREAILRLLDYPQDYDQTFLPKTAALEAAQVREAAKARWDISDFVIVIVGNQTAFEKIKELQKSGPEYLRNFQVRRIGFDERIKLG